MFGGTTLCWLKMSKIAPGREKHLAGLKIKFVDRLGIPPDSARYFRPIPPSA